MTSLEPWQDQLAAGDREAAWDAFLDRHRRLLFATIGRLVPDSDERMDAFAHLCETLRRDDFRRLRAWRPDGGARVSTWLVTVARHLVIDWIRSARGRSRLAPALARLTPIQRAVFQQLTEGRHSYVEIYERLRAGSAFEGGFGAFLREVRELHRVVAEEAGPLSRELIGSDPTAELTGDPARLDECRPDAQRAVALLDTFPADVRTATLLYVVDEMPADEVARLVGWPDRKTVYNRVYRTLEIIRRRMAGGPE